MSSRVEDLRDLAQLLDDGKITPREFEVVKAELLEASVEDWAGPPIEVEALPVEVEALPFGIPIYNGAGSQDVTPHEASTEVPEAGPADEEKSDPDWLEFAKQIPQLYWASLGCALLTIFFGGAFSPIAWVAVGVSIVTLAKVKDQAMRWMAWTGLVVGLVFTMIGIVTSGPTVSADAQTLSNTSAEPEGAPEIPVGSLGVEFADLTEGWNALPDPPFILKGITTTPEAGALDSFVYRFDDAALLAGAYDPPDGYVYALMARVGVRHESLSNVFLHLCYLLYPGTQECFDTFIEESDVYGKTPDELSAADHSASWMFLGNEWRVEVVDDIETIRVLGPLQAADR